MKYFRQKKRKKGSTEPAKVSYIPSMSQSVCSVAGQSEKIMMQQKEVLHIWNFIIHKNIVMNVNQLRIPQKNHR